MVLVSGSVVCLLFTLCFLAKAVFVVRLGYTFLASAQEGLVVIANYYKKMNCFPEGKRKVRSSGLE